MKKMKKYISFAFTALLALVMFSGCTKKADVEGIEPKLPAIKISSLGYQQTGPFTLSNTVLELNFGATTTKTNTGKFTIEILNGTTATSPVLKLVTFNAWTGKDDTSIGTVTNHQISYTLIPTSYPNTNVYGGRILLKLSALGLTAGTTYSVRATAYTADNTAASASSFTQTSFFRVI